MAFADTEHAASARLGVAHYTFIWLVLLLLAGASLLVTLFELPGAWPLVLALAIATAKAALVVLFFMHLIAHRGASRLSLAVAFLFTAVLIAFSVADVATRFPIANPPSSVQARDHLTEQPPLPWSGEQNLRPERQPHYDGP